MSSVDDNDTDFLDNPPTQAETLRFIKLLTRIGPEERRQVFLLMEQLDETGDGPPVLQ